MATKMNRKDFLKSLVLLPVIVDQVLTTPTSAAPLVDGGVKLAGKPLVQGMGLWEQIPAPNYISYRTPTLEELQSTLDGIIQAEQDIYNARHNK